MPVSHRSDATVAPLVRLVGRGRATIGETFRARSDATPDALFLVWKGRRWSYAQARQEAEAFARLVAALAGGRVDGAGGFRVATYLPNGPEALFSMLGTHLAGAVYVPLNRMHKGAILEDMLMRARADVLIADAEALPRLPDLRRAGMAELLVVGDTPADPPAQGAAVRGYAEALTRAPPAPSRGFHAPRPADLAVVMYTSGTTGRSKAVRIPHAMFTRGGAHLVDAFGYRGTDVFHCWMPLCHVAGQLHTAMSAIVAGAAIALFPTFSASRFWEEVAETGATVLTGLPNILNILWNGEPSPEDDRTTLRVGLVGMLPGDLRDRFEKRFGVTLYDTYGMTEMEPLTLPLKSGRVPGDSAGVPGPDFELAILDPDDMELPPGKTGEICARPLHPDVMMQGYEDDDAATLAQWRNLWWHTGDLGFRDEDGFFYVRGRIKHMIRRRGENISATELEEIFASHPDVAECAAVGVPAAVGDEDVKAVLVPRAGAALDPAAFHAWCTDRMARFMVPRFVELMDVLPVSGIGKVDKERLRENSSGAVFDAEAEPATGAGARTGRNG